MSAQPHSHEHVHDGDPGHIHDIPVETAIERSYAPARLVCLGLAVFFGLIGVIGLNRMGLDFNNLRGTSTEVMGIGMTPLLAIIFCGIALMSLLSAATGPMARGWMLILGPMLLAAGIVLIMRPGTLNDWLAMNRTTGVAYFVAGGASIATVIGTPITWARRSREAIPA